MSKQGHEAQLLRQDAHLSDFRRYPLCLDLRDKSCLVVGGGAVAARKIEGLQASGARILLVSPAIDAKVEHFVDAGRVKWKKKRFSASDLRGIILAFAATSDRATNSEVARCAGELGIWVNVADDPEASDFHVPAVHRRGEVCIAVSTQGRAPVLSSWLRDELAGLLPQQVDKLVLLLALLRSRYLSANSGVDAAIKMKELLGSGVPSSLALEDWEGLRQTIEGILGVSLSVEELQACLQAESE